MNEIHSTAIVEDGAELGDGIKVGPHAIIGSRVRIGDGCEIGANAVLEGPLRIGEGNRIGIGAHIGGRPQDFAFDPATFSETVIGDRNVIREYVTVHRGTKEGTQTRIGDDNYIMVGCHLAHNCQIGNSCILANNVLLAGYTVFGDRIVVGGDVVFHQFMRVGDFAMVRGGTAWSKAIPPYTIGGGVNLLAGINSIGLRRGGFSPEEREEISAAYKLAYRSGLNFRQAIEAAKGRQWSPAAQKFFDFLSAPGKLGLCPARQRGQKLGAPLE